MPMSSDPLPDFGVEKPRVAGMESNGGPYLDRPFSDGHPLRHTTTAATTTITLTPEQFEKIYLSPQSGVKGDLRATFANPTPL